MSEMTTAVSAIYACIVVVGVWFMICNNRTYSQRQRYIDRELSACLRQRRPYRPIDEVMTYNCHVWSLFLLRSPSPVYERWLASAGDAA